MDRPPVIEHEGTQKFKLGSPLSLTSCFLSRRIIKIQVMPQGIKRTMQRLSFHTSCFLFIRHSHTNKDLQKSHTHTLSHTHTFNRTQTHMLYLYHTHTHAPSRRPPRTRPAKCVTGKADASVKETTDVGQVATN